MADQNPEAQPEQPAVFLGWGDDSTINVPGVFRGLEHRMHELRERIESLNRRGKRIGAPTLEIRVYGESLRPQTRWSHVEERQVPTGAVEVFTYFEVIGARPKVNGWEFIASLEHAGEAGTILRAAPGKSGRIPAEFRKATNVCAHCRADRRRIETFLLQHEDGRYAQIGRNCLQDFIGATGVDDIAKLAEIAFSLNEACGGLDEDEGGSWGGHHAIYTSTFLGFVAAAIRSWGWMSRGRAKAAAMGGEPEPSTADMALRLLNAQPSDFEPRNGNPPLFTRENLPTKDDFAAATAAIDWVREEMGAKPELTDYEHNVVIISKLEVIRPKNLGIAASIVAAHQRHLNQLQERERLAKAGQASTHLGKLGERIFVRATVVSLKDLPSQWGVTVLHKLVDDAGNVLTCFTGSTLGQRGETVLLRATVKEHSEFRGTKETVITRPVGYTPEGFEAEIAKAAKKAERAAKKAAKAAAGVAK